MRSHSGGEAGTSDAAAAPGEPDRDALVELGEFGPPHGLGGELRLRAITDEVEARLGEPGRRWAWRKGARRRQPLRELQVEGIRETITRGRATWLVKLAGVDSVEAADALRGLTLCMLAEERPALQGQDEFYVQELVGMRVALHSSKRVLGRVADVYAGTGTHDLLRVEIDATASAAEGGASEAAAPAYAPVALVPFVRDIVPVVDREARLLEIDPPEGLLNLRALLAAGSTSKKKARKGRRRRRKPAAAAAAEPQPAAAAAEAA